MNQTRIYLAVGISQDRVRVIFWSPVAEKDWEGDWQVDGCLVWLRKRDGKALVRYLPQIV